MGSGLALGRGSVERLRQPRSVQKPAGERNAAYGSFGLIFLPARAGQVTARHALHGEHASPLDQYGAALQLIGVGVERGGKPADVGRNQMVGHHIREQIEPEERKLGQNPALARNSRGQHVVEGRDAVGGHHQQRAVHGIQIAHLAPAQQGGGAQVGCQ